MRYEILAGEVVVTAIEAEAAFMLSQYPAGNYRLAPLPSVAEPAVRLSRVEFMRRIGGPNWLALKAARATDPSLDFALDQLELAAWVEPSHATTQQLAAYCISQNYITQGDADAALVEQYLEGETGP